MKMQKKKKKKNGKKKWWKSEKRKKRSKVNQLEFELLSHDKLYELQLDANAIYLHLVIILFFQYTCYQVRCFYYTVVLLSLLTNPHCESWHDVHIKGLCGYYLTLR